MDLWERGLHTGQIGDTKAEGATREGRANLCGEEEDEAVARSYHDKVLYGKLRQDVRRATDREGVSSQATNAQKPDAWLQRSSGRSTQICVSPPWKNPLAQASRSMRRCQKRYY